MQFYRAGLHMSQTTGILAMTQSASIPLLKNSEQQLVGLRGRLEEIFRSLSLVRDIAVVCGRACDAVSSDTDAEVSHVLRRCGTDELHTQMKVLTEIIELLGGRTEFCEEQDPPGKASIFHEEP